MIDKDAIFTILDDEHSKCMETLKSIENGSPMLYAIAQNIALLQILRKRVKDIN